MSNDDRVRPGPRGHPRAASTHPSARSDRSAARRASSCRPRRVRHRCRRPRVHRPRRLVGSGDPRPRPPRRRLGGSGCRSPRSLVRSDDSGRDRARRTAARATAVGVTPFEQLRLVSTGTEATMTAIRLARGVTGRDLLVKFAGHYHGHSDGLLAEAGSGVATLALPGSAGVPADDRRADPRPAVQRPRRRRGDVRRASADGSPRSSPRRQRRTWACWCPATASTARSSELAHAHGRAPDPRRGAHRLPRRPRRLVGAGDRPERRRFVDDPTS